MVDTLHAASTDIFERTKRDVAEAKDMSSRVGGGKDIMSILGRPSPTAPSGVPMLTGLKSRPT
jgi:hypothetical protein